MVGFGGLPFIFYMCSAHAKSSFCCPLLSSLLAQIDCRCLKEVLKPCTELQVCTLQPILIDKHLTISALPFCCITNESIVVERLVMFLDKANSALATEQLIANSIKSYKMGLALSSVSQV